MRPLLTSARFLFLLTLLTGIAYPMLMTGIGEVLFPARTHGSLLSRGGRPVGSEWVGQKFESSRYFWSRPSAVESNPWPSAGSNLSPASRALRDAVNARDAGLRRSHGADGVPPADLRFASASGIDPHLSPAAAAYQSARVARARGLDEAIVNVLIARATERPQFGILGEPRVNVVRLNLALDAVDPGIHGR